LYEICILGGWIEMNVLALEVSTSSAKALVYSSVEGVKAISAVPYGEQVSDVASQDAEGVYKTLEQCIEKVMDSGNYKIDAIGLCTAWHSLLFLDKNRKPLGRIMTWADTQAGETARKYRNDDVFCRWFYKITGCMIHSTYPIWKYIDLKTKKPDFFKNVAFLSSLQEYVFEKLTGEIAVSKTVASGSGMLNIRNLKWDEAVLNFAGLDESQLAHLREPDYTAPLNAQSAERFNLEEGIPVILGGADGALNQIGAGAIEKGTMTLSIGTSAALRFATDQPVLPQNPATWCYYIGKNKWVAGASTAGAGNCVEWFVKKLNNGSGLSYADADNAVERIDKETAPWFLPFLYGERCPGWEDYRMGGFCGLKGEHRIGHLHYAVLEGVLFNLYHCYSILREVLEPAEQIRVSGGIINSEIWLQMAADIFQSEVVTSEIEHASILGAVALVLYSQGEIKNLQDFKPQIGKKIIPSKKNKEFYMRRFESYMEWYQKMKCGIGICFS